MSQDPRFDDLLYTITQQRGEGCPGLLDSLFGFLYRRTDFFYEMEPGDKMGFPPGQAESMVGGHFKKYQDLHFKRFPPKADLKERWDKFYEEKDKKEKEKQSIQEEEMKRKIEEQFARNAAAAGIVDNSKKEEKKVEPPVKEAEKPSELPKPTEPTPKPVKVDKPVEEKKTEKPFDPSKDKIGTYNGGTTERYNWSQGINDLTVQIPLPPGTKPADLKVDIQSKRLSVKFKKTGEVVIEGEFFEKVKVDETLWSVEDNKALVLNLEKASEVIWNTVLKGDVEIDPKKVDNAKKLEEFDVETQGHLRKIFYEQDRQRKGMPTTDEEVQQQRFQKVFNMDNSPFKGNPYDPTKFYGNNRPPPFA